MNTFHRLNVLNTGTDKEEREDLFCTSLIGDGEERIGNTELTELEKKRAAIHPNASLKDEFVRQTRATALGISQYEYEKRLDDMGMDYR